MKFDWFGFGVFAMGIAGFQLMLDRGETQDWFGSSEIIIEAVMAGLGFYLFIVHMMTRRSRSLRRQYSRTATCRPGC